MTTSIDRSWGDHRCDSRLRLGLELAVPRITVIGNLFFMLAQLLLQFLDDSLGRSQNIVALGTGHEIAGFFGRNLDFNIRFGFALQIHRNGNRRDSIEEFQKLSSLLLNELLGVGTQFSMSSGNTHLHVDVLLTNESQFSQEG